MRCLIGFFSPTSGRVRVGGVDVAERPVVARGADRVPARAGDALPGADGAAVPAFVAGMKGLAARSGAAAVDEVIATCGLADVAKRPTGNLSKGYRQRVGLAQALLGDPDVLVLDEPTVGLDPVQTVELRELVRGARAGWTVLLSTHILSEAAALCTRVAILKQGRLLAGRHARRARAARGAGRGGSWSASTARRRRCAGAARRCRASTAWSALADGGRRATLPRGGRGAGARAARARRRWSWSADGRCSRSSAETRRRSKSSSCAWCG